MKQFLVLLLPIALLPIALAGCAVPIGQFRMPMTLGPGDSKATCLTYDDAPAYGDCQKAGSVSISPQPN